MTPLPLSSSRKRSAGKELDVHLTKDEKWSRTNSNNNNKKKKKRKQEEEKESGGASSGIGVGGQMEKLANEVDGTERKRRKKKKRTSRKDRVRSGGDNDGDKDRDSAAPMAPNPRGSTAAPTSSPSSSISAATGVVHKPRDGPNANYDDDGGGGDWSLRGLSAQERCDLMADLCESILEDPAAALATASDAMPMPMPSSETEKDRGGKPVHDENGGDKPSVARASYCLSSSSSSPSPSPSSKMGRLLELCDMNTPGNDHETCRLALLSSLAVYRDILPSYRIRLPTESERSVRVTKETKQLWDYERRLLRHYQTYLKLLQRTWTNGGGGGTHGQQRQAPSALAVTSILCLCELLKSAPHFNFRSEILSIIVRQSNHASSDEISYACCRALSTLFASDAQGDVALEAVRLVAKLIRDRNYVGVRPDVLRTFLALPLRVHEDEAHAAKVALAVRAKKRRKDREGAGITDDMKEGEATVDKIALARAQSDALQAVTITYFRILKSDDLYDTTQTGNGGGGGRGGRDKRLLLPAALEGLAKFAHLIDADTVKDLLDVLKSMLRRGMDTAEDNNNNSDDTYEPKSNVSALPLESTLRCIRTAFQALDGPGRELPIDQKEYVAPLYAQLVRLCYEQDNVASVGTDMMNENAQLVPISRNASVELAIRCVTDAFLTRREYSPTRVASFVRRLCCVSLHAPPSTSVPFLCLARRLLERYPSTMRLLENEDDVATSGKYDPDGGMDPDYANPYGASAWELSLLKFHIHPAVSDMAIGAAFGRALRPALDVPDVLAVNIARDAGICRIVQKVCTKKHPLRVGGGGGGKRKRGERQNQQQVRFITPRRTANHHLK